MTRNTLIVLVAAAVIAIAGGWYFGTSTQPVQRTSVDAGKLMYPDLTAKLKDARRIEITSKGRTTVIALKDNVWGVEDRGGYRVQEAKLRGLLTGLTELRLVEPRTQDPAEFNRIGVEDPAKEKDGTAILLRVLDAKGDAMVDLIVGHRRARTQGNVPEQVFVRRPGETQSWLADGQIQADADPQVWLDRDIMNIAHGLITRVTATKDGQTVVLERDGDKLKVTRPAEVPKLEDYKIDDVARALESLTFQDVKPANEPIGETIGSADFLTSDGLDIRAVVHHLEKDSWTLFTVTAEDRGKPEADRLNAKFAGWAFQTGAWKDKSLVPSLDDLKAPPPPAPAASSLPRSPPAPEPATTGAKDEAPK